MRFRTTTLILLGLAVPLSLLALDDNNDGLSDVWVRAHGDLPPAGDKDGDGATNANEEDAGTDPADAQDRFAVSSVSYNSTAMTIKWPSKIGKIYTTSLNPNVSDPASWAVIGNAMPGTGGEMTASFPMTPGLTRGSVVRKRFVYGNNGVTLDTVKASVNANATPELTANITQTATEYGTVVDTWPHGNFVEGWIIPQVSGTYSFWIASDDTSELHFAGLPLTKQTSVICSVSGWTAQNEWGANASQHSRSFTLQAGMPYYFKIFHQSVWGGYHMSVAWDGPGISRQIIPSQYLARGEATVGDLGSLNGTVFSRVDVADVDTDGDGITDYEEHLLGFDPTKTQTVARINDVETVRTALGAESTITVGTSAARAYEAEGEPGVFTLFRTGGVEPVTARYTITGTASSGADFPALSGTVHFPLAAKSVNIPLPATHDFAIEPAETVILNLSTDSAYKVGNPARATVTIDDAKDVLFIATIRGGSATSSRGSGYAALRMAGNKVFAKFSLNFTNLTSPEQSAVVLIKQGQTETPVLTFSPGQVASHIWNFQPVGGTSTATIVQALEAGNLYIRLYTDNFSTPASGGEAEGRFIPNLGWQTMPTPPTPATYNLTYSDAEAARFLIQATYGPTLGTINALKNQANYGQWITDQIAMPPTRHLEYVQDRRAELQAERNNPDYYWQRPRQEAWWEVSLRGEDQLRQRMALALSEIFVVSDIGVLDGSHEAITYWYDMLVENAFINYRELLEKVTLSPMMGQYLSMALNRKANAVTGTEPDENYAREIQQLFSIGLYELNQDGSARLDAEGLPIPTYNQERIVNFARVFTGWGYSGGNYNFYKPWPVPLEVDTLPLKQYPTYHDTDPKTLHHGVTIPANTSGEAEMEIAMDNLFNHPNTGPFMARQLIQRFVTSNPSPGYIYRVAGVFNNNGSGVRGDLAAVVRAILLDPEARDPQYISQQAYGKLKEPLLQLTHMYRAGSVIGANVNDRWFLPQHASKPPRLFIDAEYDMNQAALKSPSVFNFFQPGYIPPGRLAAAGVYAPEFQILSETSSINLLNQHYSRITWGTWTPEVISANNNWVTRMQFTDAVAILTNIRDNSTHVSPQFNSNDDVYKGPDFTPLVDHYDKVFMAGQMSQTLRDQIQYYYHQTWRTAGNWWYIHRTDEPAFLVQHAMYPMHLVLASPEFAIQK